MATEENENPDQGKSSLEEQSGTLPLPREESAQSDALQEPLPVDKPSLPTTRWTRLQESFKNWRANLTLTNFAAWAISLRNLLVNMAIIGFLILLIYAVVQNITKYSVVIMDFEVADEFVERGYTGQGLANKLIGQMSYLEAQAKFPSSTDKYDIALASHSRTKPGVLIDSIYSTVNPNPINEVEVPDAGFSLGTVIQTLNFRDPSSSVVGDIRPSEQYTTEYVLSVQVIGQPTRLFTGTLATLDSMDETTMRQAAEYVYEHISPFTLAAYFYNLGRAERSEEIIRYCLNNDTHDDDYLAYNLWGMIFLDQGKYEESIAMFESAIKSDPQAKYTAFISWGTALHSQKEYAKAISKYRAAIGLNNRQNPRLSAMAYSNLGMALAELGRNEAATDKFQKAIELDPTYALAYNNWGWIERKNRKYDVAIEKFEIAIILDPTFGLAYYNLGETYLSMNNRAKTEDEQKSNSSNALHNLEQAVRYSPCDSPESFWALYTLIYNLGVRYNLGECEKVRTDLSQADDN